MKTNKLLSSLSCLLLAAGILFSVIDYCCFDTSFYIDQYNLNDTAASLRMSDEDLAEATTVLLDYLRDKRDDIVVEAEIAGAKREVFNERETAHMVDVKALYKKAVIFKNIILLSGILGLIGSLYLSEKHYRFILKYGFIHGIALLFLFICFIMIWVMADFNGFWVKFHQLFFTNDLWLLDPNTSIMINMFPSSFFSSLVIRIIVIFFIILTLGIIAVFGFTKREEEV